MIITQKIRNYLITYFVFAFSATSFFSNDKRKFLIFYILLIALHIYFKIKISKKLIPIIFYLIFIYIIQTILYQKGSIFSFITFISFVVFVPYLAIKIVGLDIFKYYVNVIFFLSIISLIFFTLSNISESFYQFTATIPVKFNTDLIKGYQQQFIIYTYEVQSVYGLIRNPGPTWEPGAWASFIILAFVINYIRNEQFLEIKNIVFILTIITTFSSAGYLSLFILIIYQTLKLKINPIFKIILTITLVYASIIIYNKLEFLESKISTQIELDINRQLDEPSSGRILGARKSLYSISKHPIIGRGLLADTKPESGSPEDASYGFLAWGARIGIIGFFVYFFHMFIFFKQYYMVSNHKKIDVLYFISIILSLLIQLFSQIVYATPIFILLVYFSVLKKEILINYYSKLKMYNGPN